MATNDKDGRHFPGVLGMAGQWGSQDARGKQPSRKGDWCVPVWKISSPTSSTLSHRPTVFPTQTNACCPVYTLRL